MEINPTKKIILEISGFVFYLYELHSFFYNPQIIYDGSAEVYFLKLIFLLLALPLLYLFRIAYFFDWGDALSSFLSGVFKFEDSNTFFQVKLFYFAIYGILSVLLFFEFIEYISKFF
jgi:hypothetical protein